MNMYSSKMQSMCAYVVDVVFKASSLDGICNDRAFAAPRGVQDEGSQGFCVVSRVVDFQGVCSPSSVDSSFERQWFVQCVVLFSCSVTKVALQSVVLFRALRVVHAFPTVNRRCRLSEIMENNRLDLFLVSYK